MLSLQEKIDLILNSNSLNEVPREALPSSHKEEYAGYRHKGMDGGFRGVSADRLCSS